MEEEFKEFGADLFHEISYDKTIAEDFLSSSVFQEQDVVSKLQAILRLFSLISEYNHLDITVTSFYFEGAIKEKLTTLINTHCPGEETPLCSLSTPNKKKEANQITLSFFNNWFSWMDSFPKEDYQFFLQEKILPLLQQCHDFEQTTSVTQVSKWDRSYQCNNMLVFSTNNKHLLLEMQCDVY
ncbi:MAG: hypothetical protein ACRBFS_22720 [Aureispira sp.]